MHTLAPELQIFTTADGSPTLIYSRPDGYIEKMHHTAGALSESLYIYHHGLTLALQENGPPSVLSIGLGLAYNELIAVAEFTVRRTAGWQIWSFESLAYLRGQFEAWAGGYDESEYAAIMNVVCGLIAGHFKMPDLRERVAEALQAGRLQLRGPFPQEAQEITGAGVVFYDAFSNKMSPELWAEQDLQKSLQPLIGPKCVLCTYAATGNLNRVLKSLGFRLLDRRRFRGKRNSTLAIRP